MSIVNGTTGGKVTAAAVAIGMAPVNAVVQSWTMQKLWAWFLSREYGPGPSMGAWYGIGALVGVAFMLRLFRFAPITREEEWDKPSEILIHSIVVSPVCLLILGSAWVLGSIMGWVA